MLENNQLYRTIEKKDLFRTFSTFNYRRSTSTPRLPPFHHTQLPIHHTLHPHSSTSNLYYNTRLLKLHKDTISSPFGTPQPNSIQPLAFRQSTNFSVTKSSLQSKGSSLNRKSLNSDGRGTRQNFNLKSCMLKKIEYQCQSEERDFSLLQEERMSGLSSRQEGALASRRPLLKIGKTQKMSKLVWRGVSSLMSTGREGR